MDHDEDSQCLTVVINTITHKQVAVVIAMFFSIGFSLATEGTEREQSQMGKFLLQSHFKPPAEFEHDYGNYRSPLLFTNGSRVRHAADWTLRRSEILKTWHGLMGPWPDILLNPKKKPIDESVRGGVIQQIVQIQTASNQFQNAIILNPRQPGLKPAVLVVYYEPETSVGMNPKQPDRDFGLLLAQNGFVTLNIGTPGGNAWKPDLSGAVCQPLAYHAYVAANCWNLLASLPEVDPKRIGIVGHSYGGKWALFAAAFWEKYAAVAVSDPGIVFDETRTNVNYWEPWYLGFDMNQPRTKAGIPTTENPRTGAYKRMFELGLDLHEIHALIAPRPFLLSGGAEDPPSRWRSLNHLVAINKLLGYPNRVAMTQRPEHAPNPKSNSQMIEFFQRFLDNEMRQERSGTKSDRD